MVSIQDWFKENKIIEVEAIVPDVSGVARGKIVPAEKYSQENGMRLPEGIFLQTVAGDFPDEYYDDTIKTDGDIILRPDLSTLCLVPWATEPTAQVIHDAYHHDGRMVDIAPRYVLQRVLKLYEERGWKPVVAPELEFFLVKPNTDSDYPLEPPVGRSGRPESGRQSYSIDAVNEFEPLVEDVYNYCEKQGLEIDTLIHEAGAAQLEINLLHGNALTLADQAFRFKRTMRETALRHSMYATFMAKPMQGQPGSAMHIHQSVVDAATGENIFSQKDGQPSAHFHAYIAGLQKYTPAVMAMLAPNVNSYRRLGPNSGAPVNVNWGYDNRTAAFRVPMSSPEARRVENRLPGADANPYLAMAATLACGYLGLIEGQMPSQPSDAHLQASADDLPQTLNEALRLFGGCEVLRDVLGDRFVEAYRAVKHAEYLTFWQVISSWEREYLLLNV
ncbi:glutamine synthetase [Pokkaliibacter plantistimulans]|uniref:Glutamine synthetase n=3 Tax=Pseudomonadota TaxID=1224 RepID=A0ABX5LZU5_9GAMM|nr:MULTISPECIES: glutamine synthetase family protein [Pokkaliibacter]MDH2434194.1 glutamine synthetase family protein [Pokkaliibacter sp. MBI-7]PPC74675.1 glutamine synthetase [Pokkaliibacter plantistimulans]PXF31831.1 glutamine synthetase [Pokkaliibacter plantistimulans]